MSASSESGPVLLSLAGEMRDAVRAAGSMSPEMPKDEQTVAESELMKRDGGCPDAAVGFLRQWKQLRDTGNTSLSREAYIKTNMERMRR